MRCPILVSLRSNRCRMEVISFQAHRTPDKIQTKRARTTDLGMAMWCDWTGILPGLGSNIWRLGLGGSIPCRRIDDGFIVAGNSWSGPSGNKTSAYFGEQDFWVIRTDRNGAKLWERDFGGTDYSTRSFACAKRRMEAVLLAACHNRQSAETKRVPTTVTPTTGSSE